MEKNTGSIENIKKIAVVGPESTGKSTLSEMLAKHYHTTWVKEYAREYIEQLDRPYRMDDLDRIARGQIREEDRYIKEANKLLICDTNLIVIKIWSEYKYGHCEDWIMKELNRRKYDLHLLTYIDIPWADDPQREHPDKREFFYKIYQEELDKRAIQYVEIRGSMEERFNKAVYAINALL